jgi:hypothetical protein
LKCCAVFTIIAVDRRMKITIVKLNRFVGRKIAFGNMGLGVTSGLDSVLWICGYGVGEDSIGAGLADGFGDV